MNGGVNETREVFCLTPLLAFGSIPSFTLSVVAGKAHCKMRSVRWLFPVLALACGRLAGSGAETLPPYMSRSWGVEDGLPHNSVLALAQTPDGFLWIGTRGGLARFDGSRFVDMADDTFPELKKHSVTALQVTRDGSLWIGTESQGLLRFKDGRFIRLAPQSGFTPMGMLDLEETRDGSLWVSTKEGLFRGRDQQFTRFTEKDGLTFAVTRGVLEDRHGHLWVADNGVDCFDQGDIKPQKRLAHYDESRDLPSQTVMCLGQDHRGDLWFGSYNGVTRWREGQLTSFTKNDGLPANLVTVVYEDVRGNLWFGTYGGLCRFDGTRFIAEPDEKGESFDRVQCIFEDHEGNLWVGAKDGLYQLKPRVFTSLTRQNGLEDNNVMSVMEGRDGEIWLATWGSGLHRLFAGVISRLPLPAGKADLALGLCLDKEHNLWAGLDYQQGMVQWQDGKLTQFTSKHGLVDPAVAVIYEDGSRRLWLGTRTALVRFEGNQFTRFTTNNGLAGDMVHAIQADKQGNLWIGTSDGLSRWDGKAFHNLTERDGLPNPWVSALRLDANGALWVGTRAGLAWLDHGRLRSISSRDGLLEDSILEMLEDDAGFFWFCSVRGIFRARRRELEDFARGERTNFVCFAYGKADGAVSAQCNGVAKPSAWKSRDGRLWFATTKGLAVADPRLIPPPNQHPPPVVVTEVLADAKLVLPSAPAQADQRDAGRVTAAQLPGASVLTIAPGNGELEFHYAALSYRMPEKNRYQFRLDGVDRDWQDASSRRVAYYNNLPPGHYTFRVKACNSDGIWNEQGATASVLLLPHFWQMWWFRFVAGCSVVSAVAGGGWLVAVRRDRQRREKLERQHALERERSRIAQDIHDDLGASLTHIGMLSQSARFRLDLPSPAAGELDQIYSTTRALTRAMEEVVWAVSPKHDTADSLANYLGIYAQDFASASRLRCRLDLPAGVSLLPLSSQIRHNVFLAFKEALNNVAKHAAATEVRVALKVAVQSFTLTIEDNGRGLREATPATPPEEPAKPAPRLLTGHGLANMRSRLQEVGGRCEIESQPGLGTQVRLTVPIP